MPSYPAHCILHIGLSSSPQSALLQVFSRRFIKANGFDTSYSCLARRAAKTNNFWNRIVRKGSTLRRVFMFGEHSSI